MSFTYNARMAWGPIKPLTTTQLLPGPASLAISPPNQGPWIHESLPWTAFWWDALTMGYGASALYATQWKLGVVHGMTLSEAIAELHDVAGARADHLRACYVETSALVPGGSLLLRRGTYEFVEPSEKVGISFLLGSVLAQVCVPRCLDALGVGKPNRLYHRTLLAAADLCSVPVIVDPPDATPDFIGFDAVGRVHVVEAKGRDYAPRSLSSGLDQIDKLKTVDGASPHTKCVSFTFPFTLLPPMQGTIATSVVLRTIDAQPVGGDELLLRALRGWGDIQGNVPRDGYQPWQLEGLYALGLACWLVNAEHDHDTSNVGAASRDMYVRLILRSPQGPAFRILLHHEADRGLRRLLERWASPDEPAFRTLESGSSLLRHLDDLNVEASQGVHWLENKWLGLLSDVDNSQSLAT